MGRVAISKVGTSDIRYNLLKSYDGLADVAKSKRFSRKEIERLLGDLEIAKQRLTSREYRQSNFKPRNTLSIPDRTDEIFKDLTFYWSVGQVWKEIISKTFGNKTLRVAEIGCGPIPKVGLGLVYAQYSGSLDLIDIDRKTVKKAKVFLELFGAQFQSTSLPKSIFSKSLVQYDALLANHLLDDLILSTYCQQSGIKQEDLYDNEELYEAVWDQIISNTFFVPELIEKLAVTLLLKLKPGGLILLLDYPSFSHRALRLYPLIKLIKNSQILLRARLTDLGATAINPKFNSKLKFDRMRLNSSDLICFSRSKKGCLV